MFHYVYIVECADTTLYVGSTNNIERRLNQHNYSKKGAHYTKLRRPVTIKYTEIYSTLSEALKREYQIKHLTREKKLKLIQDGSILKNI